VSFNAFLKKQSYTLIHLAQNIGGQKNRLTHPTQLLGGGATAHPAPPKFTPMAAILSPDKATPPMIAAKDYKGGLSS
jgi:hypothetical protein